MLSSGQQIERGKRERGLYIRRLALVALATVLVSLNPVETPASASDVVTIQLLSVSDWHAQLEPVEGVGETAVGGAALLSSYFKAERAQNPNTLTLTAGDAFNASPPLSSFFEEEPAILAMRLMGFDADTFGNHNFDRGIAHLQRMIDLAGSSGETTRGTPFRYIASNLRNVEDNLTGTDRLALFRVGGLKVAVIGITNEDAPELLKPGSLGTIEVTNGAEAANRAAIAARKAGAQVVVVLTHNGVRGRHPDGTAYGELVDLANRVNPALVDVILGDHTNIEFGETVSGILVVQNRSKGATYARTNLVVDGTGEVVNRSVAFVRPVGRDISPDPAVKQLIDDKKAELAPIFRTVVGSSNVAIPRSDSCGRVDGRLCESLVGNVTTDAMRATYGARFAITNAGGLRDALTCRPEGGGNGFCPTSVPPPWPITRGQVLSVLPFGNAVATVTLNGEELKMFLEHGVSAMPAASGRFAQVSGLCFSYDVARAAPSRVTDVVEQAADGTCTATNVDLSASSSYTLATNDFLAGGGDGYPNVSSRMTTRELMDEVLAEYVRTQSPVTPTVQGRITCLDGNGPDAPNCPIVR